MMSRKPLKQLSSNELLDKRPMKYDICDIEDPFQPKSKLKRSPISNSNCIQSNFIGSNFNTIADENKINDVKSAVMEMKSQKNLYLNTFNDSSFKSPQNTTRNTRSIEKSEIMSRDNIQSTNQSNNFEASKFNFIYKPEDDFKQLEPSIQDDFRQPLTDNFKKMTSFNSSMKKTLRRLSIDDLMNAIREQPTNSIDIIIDSLISSRLYPKEFKKYVQEFPCDNNNIQVDKPFLRKSQTDCIDEKDYRGDSFILDEFHSFLMNDNNESDCSITLPNEINNTSSKLQEDIVLEVGNYESVNEESKSSIISSENVDHKEIGAKIDHRIDISPSNKTIHSCANQSNNEIINENVNESDTVTILANDTSKRMKIADVNRQEGVNKKNSKTSNTLFIPGDETSKQLEITDVNRLEYPLVLDLNKSNDDISVDPFLPQKSLVRTPPKNEINEDTNNENQKNPILCVHEYKEDDTLINSKDFLSDRSNKNNSTVCENKDFLEYNPSQSKRYSIMELQKASEVIDHINPTYLSQNITADTNLLSILLQEIQTIKQQIKQILATNSTSTNQSIDNNEMLDNSNNNDHDIIVADSKSNNLDEIKISETSQIVENQVIGDNVTTKKQFSLLVVKNITEIDQNINNVQKTSSEIVDNQETRGIVKKQLPCLVINDINEIDENINNVQSELIQLSEMKKELMLRTKNNRETRDAVKLQLTEYLTKQYIQVTSTSSSSSSNVSSNQTNSSESIGALEVSKMNAPFNMKQPCKFPNDFTDYLPYVSNQMYLRPIARKLTTLNNSRQLTNTTFTISSSSGFARRNSRKNGELISIQSDRKLYQSQAINDHIFANDDVYMKNNKELSMNSLDYHNDIVTKQNNIHLNELSAEDYSTAVQIRIDNNNNFLPTINNDVIVEQDECNPSIKFVNPEAQFDLGCLQIRSVNDDDNIEEIWEGNNTTVNQSYDDLLPKVRNVNSKSIAKEETEPMKTKKRKTEDVEIEDLSNRPLMAKQPRMRFVPHIKPSKRKFAETNDDRFLRSNITTVLKDESPLLHEVSNFISQSDLELQKLPKVKSYIPSNSLDKSTSSQIGFSIAEVSKPIHEESQPVKRRKVTSKVVNKKITKNIEELHDKSKKSLKSVSNVDKSNKKKALKLENQKISSDEVLVCELPEMDSIMVGNEFTSQDDKPQTCDDLNFFESPELLKCADNKQNKEQEDPSSDDQQNQILIKNLNKFKKSKSGKNVNNIENSKSKRKARKSKKLNNSAISHTTIEKKKKVLINILNDSTNLVSSKQKLSDYNQAESMNNDSNSNMMRPPIVPKKLMSTPAISATRGLFNNTISAIKATINTQTSLHTGSSKLLESRQLVNIGQKFQIPKLKTKILNKQNSNF